MSNPNANRGHSFTIIMATNGIVTAPLIVITLYCLNHTNNQILGQKKHRRTGLASPYKKIGTFCATECGTEGFSVVQVCLSSGL